MNWLKMASGMAARPMDEAAAPTGENGSGAANAPAPAPEAGDAAKDGGSLLGGEDAVKPAETAAADAAKGNAAKDAAKPAETAEKPVRNLLDDEPEGGGEKSADAGAAPDAEAVKTWTAGIKATDLGDGVKWDDPLLDAMAPELMKMSGGDPKKAEGVVKAFTDYQRAVAKKMAEGAAEIDRQNISACEAEFGQDLKKVVKLAREGGRIAFGDLWDVVRQERRVCNHPAFIRQMARIAQRFATDTGHVAPKEGAGDGEVGDVLHRMYKDVRP